MAGELVPLVLIPRYATFAGDGTFTTIAMEVTEYTGALVNVWRGKLLGTTPTVSFVFEESTDQVSWTDCTGGGAADPGEGLEAQYTPTLRKRWFRIKVTLTGTDPVVTCWAVGFLERRLS
jgi:hypothetical protein